MATSSALYSEQMKGIFGFNSTGPNAPIRNIRLTRESIEKMEEDQLNATHDQLDIQEEQLKILKKIHRSIAQGGSGGGIGGGSLLGTLAEGYLGWKGIKSLAGGAKNFAANKLGGIPSAARNLPRVVGGYFTSATTKIIGWSKSITGGVIGAITASRIAMRGLRAGVAAKVSSAVALLSATMLSSVTGVLSTIGGLIKSGLANAGKLITKTITPIMMGWGAYEGWTTANKVDKNNKLSTWDKANLAKDNSMDSLLFGVPSMVSEYFTGKDFATYNAENRIAFNKKMEEYSAKQAAKANSRVTRNSWGEIWEDMKGGLKGAVGLGESPESQDLSKVLSSKRRSMGAVTQGIDPTTTKSISTTSAAAAIAGAAATTASAEAIKEAKSSSVFTVTNPATNRTFTYFEVISGLMSTQVDLLSSLKDTAKKQFDVAKKSLANEYGLDTEKLMSDIQNMYGSGYTGTMGDHLGDTSSGYSTNAGDTGSDGGSPAGDLAKKTVNNQLMPTPSITSSESLSKSLEGFNPNGGVNNSGVFKPAELGDNYKVAETEKRKIGLEAAGNAVYASLVNPNDGRRGITYKTPDGSIIKRTGARNWRNNNPGNIEYGEFAKNSGAIGSDGRFAIYPDYKTGRNSKEKLLFESKGYRGMNISEAINRYAPPTENNTNSYINSVATSLGLPANTKLSDLTPEQRSVMLDAMEKVEGFREGKTEIIKKGTGIVGVDKINPRMLQSEITGDMSVNLPKFVDPSQTTSTGALDPSAVVKQAQGKEASIRKQAITSSLEAAVAEQMVRTFGPGYTAKVYSGGQKSNRKGEGTGTTRHNKGKAGDMYMYDPEGNMLSQADYAKFAQGWIAENRGGIGLQMKGGGIHVDEHKDRAKFWNYNKDGGVKLTAHTRDLIERGLKGETPEYAMTKEEAQAYLAGKQGVEVKPNVVSTTDVNLKALSKGSTGGLGRLLSNDKFAARFTPEKKASPFDTSSPFRSGMDINGDITTLTTNQAQMLKLQGTEIAKGMVSAERETPRLPDFNPQVQSNAIFNAVDSSPVKNSQVANNPTGSSTQSTDIVPRDIPHMDELGMLMANSQMMG